MARVKIAKPETIEDPAVAELLKDGTDAVDSERLSSILSYALKVNADAAIVTDEDVESLRRVGLTDKGIMQVTHIVSDFASYNKLYLAYRT